MRSMKSELDDIANLCRVFISSSFVEPDGRVLKLVQNGVHLTNVQCPAFRESSDDSFESITCSNGHQYLLDPIWHYDAGE